MAGALSPLRNRVFLGLWVASVTSHVGTWMNDTATTLAMTDLTASPLTISLVAASTSLALLVVSLPAGALADIVDRRKLLMAAQLSMGLLALGYTYAAYAGLLNATLLLAVTFLLGIGAALTMPAWESAIPQIVDRENLAGALTLDSIGLNVGRAVGPAIAGILVATIGLWLVFLLDAFTFFALFLAVWAWKPTKSLRPAIPESFGAAARGGIRYVRHSPEFRAVLVRAASFIFAACAIWALLPSRLRIELAFDSMTYGLIVGSFGAGAITTALLLPRLRVRFSADALTITATLLLAGLLVAISQFTRAGMLAGSMFIGGGAWIAQMSGLNVAAQFATAQWVRGRALSLYVVVFQSAMFVGATVWGTIASRTATQTALLLAAALLVATVVLAVRYRLAPAQKLDLEPSLHWPTPMLTVPPGQTEAPALVTVEYEIDATDETAFVAAMVPVRKQRLRDGATSWGLYRDPDRARHFLESFQVPSWDEHMRQHERVTKDDAAMEARVRKFHRGDAPPRVRHYIGAR